MADLPRFALSIRQPWAWAIIFAGKDIENRDWPTRFRGPVCIHAAKGMTNRELAEFCEFFDDLPGPRYGRGGPLVPHKDDLIRGGIIGVAEIVDCVEESASPWFFGRYGFVLRNARPVEFIPVRGALGFFEWRQRVAELEARLGEDGSEWREKAAAVASEIIQNSTPPASQEGQADG